MFVVFRCRKCGRYLYAKESTKTKMCVCGCRNNLKRVRKLARAETELEAGEIVRRLQGSGTEFDSLDKRLRNW
ncbi:DUF1922 domain-containing protein [Archaeoglobus veneficus]|uniref:DUF1922 domain-containing protein n=1 Tax=Archaeoglobus veneficus (strain DSM 11195 / SNP6) TaxID=693661 RepID=F2KNB2_ARCVS|nr:DUF1922 domain-containing protein [Archaeoglobus veneficus]AEA47314.1 Domain of unknown function DUF1922 [Archaeoglobus veneficus SNP6]